MARGGEMPQELADTEDAEPRVNVNVNVWPHRVFPWGEVALPNVGLVTRRQVIAFWSQSFLLALPCTVGLDLT